MMFCTNCGGSLEQKTTSKEATGQKASGGGPKPKPMLSKIIVGLVAALIVVFVVHKWSEDDKKQIEANKLLAFAKYDEIGEFGGYGAKGLALVRDNDHSWYGFINERFEECIPCIYQRIEPFEGDVTIVELADKYALMNKHGEIVMPLKYSEIEEFSDVGYARATANDKWWLINRKGEEIRPLPFIGFYEGHEWIDFGLPSGTLWATCNIGADKPEDYGNYYAWGETSTKSSYNWSTYQYANGTSLDDPQLTKYCNSASHGYNGFTDNLTVLQPSDDAATANWGNGWKTPTKEQWEELYGNITHTWTTQNGVYGRLFTLGNGERSLFLPAAGVRHGSSLYYAGSYGVYWSSSLDTGGPSIAWHFYFFSDDTGMNYYDYRYLGRSVRAVREN